MSITAALAPLRDLLDESGLTQKPKKRGPRTAVAEVDEDEHPLLENDPVDPHEPNEAELAEHPAVGGDEDEVVVAVAGLGERGLVGLRDSRPGGPRVAEEVLDVDEVEGPAGGEGDCAHGEHRITGVGQRTGPRNRSRMSHPLPTMRV